MDCKSRVYYQLLTYAFNDSDGNGMCDFRGIRDKIPYLKDLGIGGIWLSPIHQCKSYHGYDVMDYTSVNDIYVVDGYSIEDLIQDATANDIVIMLDMVLNHTSIEHSWFKSAVAYRLGDSTIDTYKDYYMFSDTNPNKKGWYEYTNGTKSIWYYSAFSRTMADLNYSTTFDYEHDPVFKDILEICYYWIDKGVMAFRLDGIRHIYEIENKVEDVPANQQFLVAFSEKIKAYNNDVFILGEAFIKDERVAGFSVGIDSIINFPVANQLKNLFLNTGDLINYDKQILLACRQHTPDFVLTNIISSHDEGTGRFTNTVSSDMARLYIGAMLNIMLPGIPLIYYGDEVGLLSTMEHISHEYSEHYIDVVYRTPMPWYKECMPARYIIDKVSMDGISIISKCDTIGTVHGKCVKDIVSDTKSIYHFYKSLIAIRNKYGDIFYKGAIEDVYTNWTQSKVLYYKLMYQDQVLGIIINISDSVVQYDVGAVDILHSLSMSGDTASLIGSTINMPSISISVIEYK